MAMNRSACIALARAARSNRPRQGAVAVMSSDRLAEAGVGERLFDLLRKLKIEGVFGNPARAHRAGHIDGVADIDHDAEFRALAKVRLRRGRRRLFGSRRRWIGDEESHSEQCAERQSGVPQANHEPRHPSAVTTMSGLRRGREILSLYASLRLCDGALLSYQTR